MFMTVFPGYYSQRYLRQKESVGTIVFISDLDLSEKVVCRIYCERWLLELMSPCTRGMKD